MAEHDDNPTPKHLSPSAVPLHLAAKLLRMPQEQLQRHIDQGAPCNADGTLNLLHYAAWLNHDPQEGAGHGG